MLFINWKVDLLIRIMALFDPVRGSVVDRTFAEAPPPPIGSERIVDQTPTSPPPPPPPGYLVPTVQQIGKSPRVNKPQQGAME